MKTLKVEIEGTIPLLMHNNRLANPLDPATKEYKKISGKRKKSDEDYVWLAQQEWLLGLYLNRENDVIIPSVNIESCIESGAKDARKGTAFKSAVTVPESARLKNPDTGRYYKLDNIQDDLEYYDTRAVKLKRSDTLMRTRPIFHLWAIEFEVLYDATVVDESDIKQALVVAGRLKGLGDYRPKFGKFEVKVFN